MEAPESAKTITVYVNGDQNFGGKKFIVNRRRTPTFDTLLGDVSIFFFGALLSRGNLLFSFHTVYGRLWERAVSLTVPHAK